MARIALVNQRVFGYLMVTMRTNQRITLVSYTYNDGHLVDGLLAEIPFWAVRPDAIVVVDDCSAVPYTPADGAAAVEVLRLDENHGPAGAKRVGLDTVASRNPEGIILSMDCDIRLTSDWLASTLPEIVEEGVDLLGAPILPDSGDDITSRYLRRFVPVDMDFPSGGLWLMPASTWIEAGGFGDYEARTHEDFHFCRRLAQLDMEMILLRNLPATQVRRMHRADKARQHALYMGPSLAAALSRTTPEDGLAALAAPSVSRMAKALEEQEPAFVYVEMLHYLAVVFWLAANEPHRLGSDVPVVDEVLEALEDFLAGHDRLTGLIMRDLERAGLLPDTPETEAALDGGWGGLTVDPMGPLESLRTTSLLDWMNTEGAALFLEEDQRVLFDYHYLATPPGV